MQSLKQRIRKLERKTTATTIRVGSSEPDAPLHGFHLCGVGYFYREPKETDAELETRVRAVPGKGVRFMREVRGSDIDGDL